MGCGESKHAVATADTISQSKRSRSKKANSPDIQTFGDDKCTNDVKPNANVNAPSSEGQEIVEDAGKGSEVVSGKQADDHRPQGNAETAKETEIKEEPAAVVVVAGVTEETKEKKESNEIIEESSTKKEGDGGAAVPDSPNDFFAPKKDGDAVESITSESTKGAKIEEPIKENEGTETKQGEATALQAAAETGDLAKTGDEKAPAPKEESVPESSSSS